MFKCKSKAAWRSEAGNPKKIEWAATVEKGENQRYTAKFTDGFTWDVPSELMKQARTEKKKKAATSAEDVIYDGKDKAGNRVLVKPTRKNNVQWLTMWVYKDGQQTQMLQLRGYDDEATARAWFKKIAASFSAGSIDKPKMEDEKRNFLGKGRSASKAVQKKPSAKAAACRNTCRHEEACVRGRGGGAGDGGGPCR